MAPTNRFMSLLTLATAGLLGCSRQQSAATDDPAGKGAETAAMPAATEAPTTTQSTIMTPRVADEWTVLRVAGDDVGEVEGRDGGYRFRGMLIDTPLPVGYPRPTPPGAVELKKYPSVRRAEVAGSMSPDIGMNLKFWPLFNHIKRREIAMTSPVEMDYAGTGPNPGHAPDRWTMSFLYREPANGELGKDRSVEVVDTEPVTVLATGIRGRYAWQKLQEPLASLGRWLETHPEWERAGDARALYYNGPDRRTSDLWAEVQIPVRSAGQRTTDKPNM